MIRNNTSAKKVIVALSGGVDSAVSAALLKEQGFEVVGIFFRFFDGPESKKSLNKAKKVAKVLGFPLEIVDARKEFQKKIVDYFVASYEKGITPNPCVICNKEMKFDLLLKLLDKYKAEYIATGHYARLGRESSIFNLQFSNNEKISKFQKIKLLEAKDKSKDQSYFLYRLNQKELSRIIFPLGEYEKTEVKNMAKGFKLPVLGEEESQDICFLSGKDANSFLKKHLNPRAGNIVDETGKVLAKHKGLPFYTIGQRKGIEIGGTGPYFVLAKNARKNELVVSNNPKKLFAHNFEVNRVNWMNIPKKFPLKIEGQIRYHAEKFPAIIKPGKLGRYAVETKKPLRAATPGQSAVFYKKEEVLGGGIIV